MRLSIRVPATTANLGPGFDCLGLALDWWNTIRVEPIARGLEVECHCDDGTRLPCNRRNLVIRAMQLGARRARMPLPPLRVLVDCPVPIGRGLGSSAAAIVGGLTAANVFLGNPFRKMEILELATAVEGHPDNVAAALFGGLVVTTQDCKVLAARLEVGGDLQCVLFIPDRTLPTTLARRVLPRRVLRTDAVYNVAHTALWMAALFHHRWEWLSTATCDRLHQPYRRRLIPGMDEIFAAAREAGARGVAVSGAGPTLVAFADRKTEDIAAAMEETAIQLNVPGQSRIVGISPRGVRIKRLD